MAEKQTDNFFKILESNIRQQAKASGMTLAHLSKQIDMTEAGFYKMLSLESIKIKTLRKIADILNQPVEFFLQEHFVTAHGGRASYYTEEQSAYLAEPPAIYQQEKAGLQKQIQLLESQLKDKEKIIELLNNR